MLQISIELYNVKQSKTITVLKRSYILLTIIQCNADSRPFQKSHFEALYNKDTDNGLQFMHLIRTQLIPFQNVNVVCEGIHHERRQ